MSVTMSAALLAGLLAASGTALAHAPRDAALARESGIAPQERGGLSALPSAAGERLTLPGDGVIGTSLRLAGVGEGYNGQSVRP